MTVNDDRDPSEPGRPDAPADPGATDPTTRLETPSALVRLAAATPEPVVDAVAVLEDAWSGLTELPVRGVRRVRRARQQRRANAEPLPSLAEVHPEARFADPVEVGLRTIDVHDIRGTAVGGGDQRGGDFLPLPGSRGQNWEGRWQRLEQANRRLAMLPPIDVVKYGGAYWVIDGHNRVAMARQVGQVGIDASIVELVPPGARRTEPIVSLAASVEAFRPVRARAGAGVRPDAIVQARLDTAIPSSELLDPVDATATDDPDPAGPAPDERPG